MENPMTHIGLALLFAVCATLAAGACDEARAHADAGRRGHALASLGIALLMLTIVGLIIIP